jgi:hypothetical protein
MVCGLCILDRILDLINGYAKKWAVSGFGYGGDSTCEL